VETYKTRKISSVSFIGEEINFIEANDRISERIRNLSHESELLKAMVMSSKQNDIIWDVGGCLGIHTFIISSHTPEGKVYSFEPMYVNRSILTDNMYVNNISNVNINREALSDSNSSELPQGQALRHPA
jgi:predicted O-methyltransferase YrrM